MRLLKATIALLLLALAGASQAGERLVVVELFTSQGCSSCPPADAMLGELATRDDVLPLALHVDYWDYLGWKDEFASPAFTERQRRYARAAGGRSIYTPQLIVGGVDHVIGAKPMKVAELIERHGDLPETVDLQATRAGKRLSIEAVARRESPGRYSVIVVAYMPEKTVAIGRGENAGRTISYSNVVMRMAEVGRWNGTGRFETTASVPETGEVAVLIQAEKEGPILVAARAR